jgi:hypothetical protein
LPKDLLPDIVPPPGWKPGDPIELLPGGILPGFKPQEQQQPNMPMPVGGQPKPITVDAVALDILYTSSSDEYSSDAESSEDDDEIP